MSTTTNNDAPDGKATIFNQLPPELRDIVWTHAIRDEHPGIHFFEMIPNNPGTAIERSDALTIYNQDSSEFFLEPYRYFASKGCHGGWLPGNRSIHAADAALWTTCRASRSAMQKHHQKHKYDHPTGDIDGFTGFFRNEAGEKQQFMLMTHDLVCFQTTKLPQEAYVWTDLPFLRTAEREKGITNVAIEFDPDWKAPTEGEFERTPRDNHIPTSLVVAKTALEHVWFIDYRLRRRTDITQTQKDQSYLIRPVDRREEDDNDEDDPVLLAHMMTSDDMEAYDELVEIREAIKYNANAGDWAKRQVFQGNKCRFTEVRPFDADWELSDGSLMFPRHLDPSATLDPEPMLSIGRGSPFDFVNEMEKNSWGPVYNYAYSYMWDYSLGCVLGHPGKPGWHNDMYCGHHGSGSKLHVLAYEACD